MKHCNKTLGFSKSILSCIDISCQYSLLTRTRTHLCKFIRLTSGSSVAFILSSYLDKTTTRLRKMTTFPNDLFCGILCC